MQPWLNRNATCNNRSWIHHDQFQLHSWFIFDENDILWRSNDAKRNIDFFLSFVWEIISVFLFYKVSLRRMLCEFFLIFLRFSYYWKGMGWRFTTENMIVIENDYKWKICVSWRLAFFLFSLNGCIMACFSSK